MFSKLRRPPGAALLIVAAMGAPTLALADPAPPYAMLLAQARAKAPRFAEASAQVAQAEGAALQAAAWQNPVFGLEVENFSGSGPYSGADLAETTASLAQTLELGGKRRARIAAGRAGMLAARAAADVTHADYAAQLAVAYAEAEAAAAKLDQAQEALAAAQADARAARELVDAGREAELRALQAAAERDAAGAERDAALAARETAFAKLTALAGSPVLFDAVSESLLARATASPDSAAVAPAVLAARATRDVAAARVRVEARRAAPDVTVSAGVRRFAGDDATAFVAGISTPLPLFDRNRGGTQAARAELSAAQARLRQAEYDATADLRAAQAEARGAASRAQAASAGEAAAAEAYRLARLGYEAGRLPLLELSSARRALAAARVRTLDARLARVRAEAETARLTGRTPFGA